MISIVSFSDEKSHIYTNYSTNIDLLMMFSRTMNKLSFFQIYDEFLNGLRYFCPQFMFFSDSSRINEIIEKHRFFRPIRLAADDS